MHTDVRDVAECSLPYSRMFYKSPKRLVNNAQVTRIFYFFFLQNVKEIVRVQTCDTSLVLYGAIMNSK